MKVKEKPSHVDVTGHDDWGTRRWVTGKTEVRQTELLTAGRAYKGIL